MAHDDAMRRHMEEMAAMRRRMLWVHYLVIALGAWLLTSSFQFGLLDGSVEPVRDITVERELWPVDLRAWLIGWNDIVCGLLLILFGSLSISPRYVWAQWGTTAVGLWLLFAPLLFWAPSATAYLNDTMVGALAIAFSVLVPMMPGMSHEGMIDPSTVPPGWTYSPSSWPQRFPIIALGLFGFFIARYLAAYQLGHVDGVWEPFFAGGERENGTEYIITSEVSKAWPIADAGLGATAYMIEALMGAMGSAKRWRTMPWMVTFFFILVVPLGGVSIVFIMIQPVVIGTYCTLCLIQAFAMLIMIPLAIDEVVAMGQYMVRGHKAGRPLVRIFFQGGPDSDAAGLEEDKPRGSFAIQAGAGLRGLTWPWTLLASTALGIWLMVSRALFDTSGALADSDHLMGATIVTIAVIALAEVARPLRFLNLVVGLWLIASPFLLEGAASTAGVINDIACGLLLIALSLPRGHRGHEHYGRWDRLIV